jgi:hypothetical protein
MVFATKSGAASTAAACVLACALAACVAPREAVADAAPLRVRIELTRPSDDANAIAAQAARIAGVPVTYAAATSSTWHALAVHCAGAGCDAAIARLRAADTLYHAVEIDGRKTPSS